LALGNYFLTTLLAKQNVKVSKQTRRFVLTRGNALWFLDVCCG
jgi:hypothetical protein